VGCNYETEEGISIGNVSNSISVGDNEAVTEDIETAMKEIAVDTSGKFNDDTERRPSVSVMLVIQLVLVIMKQSWKILKQ
jgi:hypothetical protein